VYASPCWWFLHLQHPQPVRLGFISHSPIKLVRGKARQARGVMVAAGLAFLVAFILQSR
jgi:hypothetical protein